MHSGPVRAALSHPEIVGSEICVSVDAAIKRRDFNATKTGRNVDDYTIVEVPPCRCCGTPLCYVPGKHPRCHKHVGKSPCAIEGCSKTTSRGSIHDGTWWLCSEHWRMACPPHSALRRTYLRFFRIAKKMGIGPSDRWPSTLENRYWRFWLGLVARARRKAAGDIDMAEINRMFGWDEK